jgi:3-oxoacyl-[acyl-carrier-protein] synthase II
MDIAIIGVGLIDSLGSSKEECWTNMLNGKVSMSPSIFFSKEQYPISKVNKVHMADIDSVDISNKFTDKDKSSMDRALVLAMHSILQCIDDSKVDSKDVSMFVGMNGNFKSAELWENIKSNKRTSPRAMLYAMRDSVTATISRIYGYTGITSTVSNMCTSSINALDYAVRSLSDGDNEYSLVTGVDSFIDALNIYAMQSAQATSTEENPLSRPFDLNRQGITLGEGSCTFMLTSLDNAIKKNHKIYSVIKGIGHGTEAVHETNMSTDGVGSRNAINMALRKAKLVNNDIGYVNCHATGTPQGDVVEYDIVSDMFPGVTVGASKANIGHTMGACGLLELFYTMQSLNHQTAPPIANLENPIGDLILLPKSPMPLNSKYAIKNSFGFGGKSCCVVLEKGNV